MRFRHLSRGNQLSIFTEFFPMKLKVFENTWSVHRLLEFQIEPNFERWRSHRRGLCWPSQAVRTIYQRGRTSQKTIVTVILFTEHDVWLLAGSRQVLEDGHLERVVRAWPDHGLHRALRRPTEAGPRPVQVTIPNNIFKAVQDIHLSNFKSNGNWKSDCWIALRLIMKWDSLLGSLSLPISN